MKHGGYPFMHPRSRFRFSTALLVFMAASSLPDLALGQPRVPTPTRTQINSEADTPAPEEPSPDPSAPTYIINLNPPNKVGQKFSLVADSSSQVHGHLAVVVLGVPTLGPSIDQGSVIHLEAEGEILAIFPNGGVQKVALTVKSLTAKKDGQPLPNVPAAGAKIVAEALTKEQRASANAATAAADSAKKTAGNISADDKAKTTANPSPNRQPPRKKITIDDKPADDDLAQLLDEVITLGQDGKDRNGQFAPQKPVAVGATWPIDVEPILEDLIHEQNITSGENSKAPAAGGEDKSNAVNISLNVKSKGTFKLDSVQGSGDDQVVAVSGKFSIDAAAASAGPTFTLVTEMHETVPAVRTKGLEKQDSTSTIQFQVWMSKIGFGIKATGSDVIKDASIVTYHE